MKDGGPAFPQVVTEWNHDAQAREQTSVGGLSLRDYFAAAALQGLRAAGEPIDSNEIAQMAYMDADAMLVAREAK